MDLETRVAILEGSFAKLVADLSENTQATKRVEENTRGLVAALANLDGFNKVSNAICKYTRPLVILIVFAAGTWKALKLGILPDVK